MKKRVFQIFLGLAMVALILPSFVGGWLSFLGEPGNAPRYESSTFGASLYPPQLLSEALGGTNNLATVSSGAIIRSSHVNQYATALQNDLVPRNSSGVPTSLSGSLGTSSILFLKAWVASGFLSAGDVKIHHSYNGAVTCGQGWMLADGRLVNEANYDAEHSAGDWDIYVISSPLDGKYLPSMTGKYPVGVASTTQDGSSAITGVGQTGHQVNIAHTHTMAHTHAQTNHHHQWYAGSSNYDSYDSGNNLADFSGTTSTGSEVGIVVGTGTTANSAGLSVENTNFWTEYTDPGNTGAASSSTTSSSLSSTQSIQPESVEFEYCMRIIN